MIPILVVAVLALLALATQAGVLVLERTYPPQGHRVAVTGALLIVVELGPKLFGKSDAAGPPVLLLHGASSNLEAMRKPLGEMLAERHRAILIARRGHALSPRE